MKMTARTTEPDAKSSKPLLGRVALVTCGSRGAGAPLATLLPPCHFAVPMLLENGWGRIINISSTTGQLVVTFGQANYAAAKAGVIGFTKALAVELARSNITVNAVAIGAMATEMWDTVPDVIKETIYEKIPMHRACTTEEAARGVRFLAVEGAYITGHALNINGGLYQG